MARKVFYSFHYEADNWRVSQVRSMGVVEGNQPASGNEWEEVKRGGDRAIKQWIDTNMSGRSCTIVLIGKNTAGRRWINYEIGRSWNDGWDLSWNDGEDLFAKPGKGLLGIYIHNLKDQNGQQSDRGRNPFDGIIDYQNPLFSRVRCYNPPCSGSRDVYNYIRKNLEYWIEEAIV